MSVSIAQYTSNSYRISIINEVTYTNILSNVNQVITTLGWSQYDYVANSTPGSSGGTHSTSPMYTYVYRAINYDGVTYKYFILRWDVVKMVFYTSTCESWNSSTHVATNESWSQVGAFAQHYDIKDCFIFIAATSRHIVIQPFIKSEPDLWTGVFEFERIATEDTPALNTPCWAWTNSVMIGSPFGKVSAVSKIIYAFPRTIDGTVGANAAQQYAPITNKGMFPPNITGVTISDNHYLHLSSFINFSPYAWDTSFYSGSKQYSSPISVDSFTKNMPFGRMYNVSVTQSFGGIFDVCSANIDSVGGWVSSSGSATDCIILPMNGGMDTGTTYASQGRMNTPVTNNFFTHTLQKVITIGDNIWAADQNNSIQYWNASSGTTGTPTVAWTAPGSSGVQNKAVIDMVFDGERTIYGSTYFGIVKIDTETLSATSLIVPGTSGSGMIITTTATAGAITSATLTSAGSNYLAGLSGTLYFTVATSGYYALLSIAVTSGVPTGFITIHYGGTGYTSGANVATTPTMGGGYLAIDGQYVYCTSRQIMIKPTVTMIDRTSFTVVSMHTSNTALTLESCWGTPVPNYSGTCYVASQHGYAASAQSQRLSSFTSSTGSVLYDVANIQNSTTSINPYFATSFYIDPISRNIYCAINIGTTGVLYQLSTQLAVLSSVTYTVNSTAANSIPSRCTDVIDYLGDLQIIPFRGIFYIAAKGRSSAGFTSRLLFSDPTNVTPGLGTYLNVNVTSITTNIMGNGTGYIHTNGPRVVYCYSNTAAYSSGVYTTWSFGGFTAARLLLKG